MKEIESILNFFERQGGKAGVMLDVGAHVGGAAQPFAALGWQVYCFEPESINYAELVKNMTGFPNVHCFSLAVSDEEGREVPFYVSDEHWGIHSLRPWHDTHRQAYTVRTTRLDNFLRAHSVDRVDFLKIDIEGADFLALKGMDFDDYHPAVVMIEFADSRTGPAYGYSHHDMVNYMTSYGYDCMVFEYGPIVEYSRKGHDTVAPNFLRAYPYTPAATPDWGNLLFYTHGDKLFEVTVQNTLAQPPPGSRWDWMPSPLRAFLRPVKRWLESLLKSKVPRTFIRIISQNAQGVAAARQARNVFRPVKVALLYRIYRYLYSVENNIIGRYAGSMTDKFAHTLPVYLAALRAPNDPKYNHVEIGTLFGGSVISKLLVLQMVQKNHCVTSIDPLESFYGQSADPISGLPVNEDTFWQNIERFGFAREQVRLVKRLSTDPAALAEISDRRILTLFIDGDHSYEGVKADWLNFAPLVEPGGYVIFDDYHEKAWPEVTRFVDELIGSLPEEWVVIGVLDTTLIMQRREITRS